MGCTHASKLSAELPDSDNQQLQLYENHHGSNKLITRQKFHFGSIIGEGGFAVIREVRHLLDDKWFALKENNLLKVNNYDAQVILTELVSLVRLSLGGSHSSIIKLHLAFRDLRSTYMVLDLLTAGDLRIYLGSREIFTEQKAAFLMSCVGSALNHMHQRKIIHRDLKPENILFDARGYPYVTDFGLSYCLSFKSRYCVCERTSGTSEYFAPEVYVPSTHYHGFESDFWSLGIILYEILFRKRPCDEPPKPLIRYSRDTYANAWAQLVKLRDEETVSFQRDDELITDRDHNFDELMLDSDRDIGTLMSFPCYPFPGGFETERLDEQKRQEEKDKDGNDEKETKGEQKIYDNETLPAELRIPIPSKLYSTKEEISSSCVDLLDSLLDVRLHQRIGVGSRYALFVNHQWFQGQGISYDETKTRPSPITPDLNLVADKINAKLMKTNFEDDNFQNINIREEKQKPLPAKEINDTIGSFTYMSPEYSSLYLTSQTPKARGPIMRALSIGMASVRTQPTIAPPTSS
jgi:serine/threonine protein kinase